eukprot:1209019-Rhodomonas_salina.2
MSRAFAHVATAEKEVSLVPPVQTASFIPPVRNPRPNKQKKNVFESSTACLRSFVFSRVTDPTA